MKICKGDLAIQVNDANGLPVPGATVSIVQTGHHYGFGTAVSLQDLQESQKGTGQEKYASEISGLFNTVVWENALKWPQLDGIGFQAYLDKDLTSPQQIYSILEQFAPFNKEIWITEFDLPKLNPQLAADYTRDFLTILFSHPSVGGVMMWGFWDGNSYGDAAPICDHDWNEKLSGQMYRDLVFNQWHTNNPSHLALKPVPLW